MGAALFKQFVLNERNQQESNTHTGTSYLFHGGVKNSNLTLNYCTVTRFAWYLFFPGVLSRFSRLDIWWSLSLSWKWNHVSRCSILICKNLHKMEGANLHLPSCTEAPMSEKLFSKKNVGQAGRFEFFQLLRWAQSVPTHNRVFK